MIKNKKAVMILIPAMIGIILGLALYFISINISKPDIKLPIGTKSITLLQIYHKSEKIIFYVDQSAELSAKKAIYALAENKISDKCGNFDDYILLNNKDKDIDSCFININDNFNIFFNNNLNDYLSVYPDYSIPINNYDVVTSTDKSKTKILGFANNDIRLEAIKQPASPFNTLKKEEIIVIQGEKETEKYKDSATVDEKNFVKAKENIEKKNYNPLIEKYGKINNIDPNIIRAIITQESVGDKYAENDNALGLMQIIPKWHSETCKKYCGFTNDYSDFSDAEKNICCGTKILKTYYDEGKNVKWDCCDEKTCVTTEYSGWESALRKYNSAKCEGADAAYVEKILGYYELWAGKPFSTKEGAKTITTNSLLGYSIKPNFKVELDFDLNIFEKIKEQAKELINNCSKEMNDTLVICIGNKIKDFDPEWKFIGGDKTERNFKFEVNTHKVLFPFEKEVIVKFAIYFPTTT